MEKQAVTRGNETIELPKEMVSGQVLLSEINWFINNINSHGLKLHFTVSPNPLFNEEQERVILEDLNGKYNHINLMLIKLNNSDMISNSIEGILKNYSTSGYKHAIVYTKNVDHSNIQSQFDKYGIVRKTFNNEGYANFVRIGFL